MEQSARLRFFHKMEEEIRESGVESNLVPPQNGMQETLSLLMPVTDEGDPSLMEITIAPFVEESDLLIFYTTMIAKINTGYDELLRVLPQWNLDTVLGTYGIFDNEELGMQQLFHKYTLLIDPEIDPEELAETAMFHLMILYEVISRQYKEAYRICKGGE